MVFCDKCNICVHQACYDIAEVLEGCWLCTTCNLGIDPQCLLCPTKGGAMKATRAGTKWAHISYALWIPEVYPNPRSHSVLSVGDWDVPQPPPRLMLKLKVPKVIIGNGKTSSKFNRTLFRS